MVKAFGSRIRHTILGSGLVRGHQEHLKGWRHKKNLQVVGASLILNVATLAVAR